ncbi:MAG: hypothetical protein P1V13_24335 [Rhizobiaceae bacterium]|nr:hypothetical protein [Rhizobiaceae bacterium]
MFNHDYESDIVVLPKTSLVFVGRDDVALGADRFSNGFNDLHGNVDMIGNQDRFCRVLHEATLNRVEAWQMCGGQMRLCVYLGNDQRWR